MPLNQLAFPVIIPLPEESKGGWHRKRGGREYGEEEERTGEGRREGEGEREERGAKKKRNKDYIIIDLNQHWGK